MAQSQVVGTVIITEKNGKVYINSTEVLTTYMKAVQLVTLIHSQAYANGFEIGKQVARRNP